MRRTIALVSLACSILTGATLVPAAARAETIHFLIGEPPSLLAHGDSYVLPLSDPADIDHARDLIALGLVAGASIAVVDIAAGADGVNRDVLADGEPAWSWHVTGFRGFADFSIEILDGWPSFVESDVAGWIANTGGQIGFWNYTVVQELPEPDGATALAGVLAALACLRALRPAGRRIGRASDQGKIPCAR